MKTKQTYRKFQLQQDKIEDLKKRNQRFNRIYSEYQLMSDELWNLENESEASAPDDFLNAVKLQTSYLEEEIEDWLLGDAIYDNGE